MPCTLFSEMPVADTLRGPQVTLSEWSAPPLWKRAGLYIRRSASLSPACSTLDWGACPNDKRCVKRARFPPSFKLAAARRCP